MGFFINKAVHEKNTSVNTLIFCITKLVDKKVKMVFFTDPAPTPIQSNSCNVHYKDEALKPFFLGSPAPSGNDNILLEYARS